MSEGTIKGQSRVSSWSASRRPLVCKQGGKVQPGHAEAVKTAPGGCRTIQAVIVFRSQIVRAVQGNFLPVNLDTLIRFLSPDEKQPKRQLALARELAQVENGRISDLKAPSV